MYLIHVKQNLVYISPVPAGLSDVLMYNKQLRKSVPEEDKETGNVYYKTKYITEKHKLYSLISADTLVTFGGMLNRAQDFMKTHKLPCVVKGAHPLLPNPDFSVLSGVQLRDGQDKAIAAIASYPRGLIVAPTGLGKTWLCGIISRIWHSANILMVAGLKSVCEGLGRECLKHNDEDEVRFMFGKYLQQAKHRRKEDARVIISSVASMSKIPPNWADLILFDEAHTAPAPVSMRALCANTKPKIFGLTASPEGRSDGADDMTIALFGQVVVDVSNEEGVASGAIAPLRVLFVDGTMPDVEYDKDTEKEPLGYWRNDERSGRIIRKAQEVATDEECVLYYTKVVEHALRIRKLFLPNVLIAHAGISRPKWNAFKEQGLVTDEDEATLMKPNVTDLEEKFRNGEIKRMICTTVWKQGTDFKDLLFLARLDGEGSPISATQVPGRATRVGSDGVARTGTIIDCNDNFGPAFFRRYQRRRSTYKKKGWDIYG